MSFLISFLTALEKLVKTSQSLNLSEAMFPQKRTLTGQVDDAGDDDEGPAHQRDHRQQLGHAAQTHSPIQIALLQTVPGLEHT